MKVLNIKPRGVCRTPVDPNSPRVFFTIKGETTEQNFVIRRLPMNPEYTAVLQQLLIEYGFPSTAKYRWDPYAGCEMCPCSPGFVIDFDYPDDFDVEVEDDELLASFANKDDLIKLVRQRYKEAV